MDDKTISGFLKTAANFERWQQNLDDSFGCGPSAEREVLWLEANEQAALAARLSKADAGFQKELSEYQRAFPDARAGVCSSDEQNDQWCDVHGQALKVEGLLENIVGILGGQAAVKALKEHHEKLYGKQIMARSTPIPTPDDPRDYPLRPFKRRGQFGIVEPHKNPFDYCLTDRDLAELRRWIPDFTPGGPHMSALARALISDCGISRADCEDLTWPQIVDELGGHEPGPQHRYDEGGGSVRTAPQHRPTDKHKALARDINRVLIRRELEAKRAAAIREVAIAEVARREDCPPEEFEPLFPPTWSLTDEEQVFVLASFHDQLTECTGLPMLCPLEWREPRPNRGASDEEIAAEVLALKEFQKSEEWSLYCGYRGLLTPAWLSDSDLDTLRGLLGAVEQWADATSGKAAQDAGKEQAWTDDAPEYLSLSEVRKLIDERLSMPTLSKLCRPSGDMRYMRKPGVGCKVHIADLRQYMRGRQNDPEWAKAYIDFREAVGKGDRRWFWRCKTCGHEYAENAMAPDRCPKCKGEPEFTSKIAPKPRR